MKLNGNVLKFKNKQYESIPLEEFIFILKQIVQKDFNMKCGNEVFDQNEFNGPMTVLIIILIVLNIIMVILYFILYKKVEDKKEKKNISVNRFSSEGLININ